LRSSVKTDRTGKMSDGDRRVAAQCNFGLSNPGIISGDYEIAHHCQFSTAAKRVPMNGGDADAVRPPYPQDKLMELFECCFDPARRMVCDIDTSRKRAITSAGNDGDLRLQIFNLGP